MQKLTDPELRIMQVLWDAPHASSRASVQERLKPLTWTANTFNTYFSRLQDKGFIACEKRGHSHYYHPIIPREAYMETESKSLLSKLFGGSLKNLVLCLSNADAVDDKELEELRTLLEELEGGRTDNG